MAYGYPAPAAHGRNRSTLWGILGIIIGLLCCGIAGIILGYLSIRDAKRFGTSRTLGWLAIILSVVNIIAGIIVSATHPLWRY